VLRTDILVENLAHGNSKSRYVFDGAPPDRAVYTAGRTRVAELLRAKGNLQPWMPSDPATLSAYPVFLWKHAPWLTSASLLRSSPRIYFRA